MGATSAAPDWTGTILLGLIKHLSIWGSRYFGEVFGRLFPEILPRWDDADEHADILREQLDGSTGSAAGDGNPDRDAAFWKARWTEIDRAANAADPNNS